MPTKRLPLAPSLSHLKNQAKDLLRDQRARFAQAAQRIREFHPRFRTSSDAEIGDATLSLSDAQLTLAREYGFRSWMRLRSHVEDPNREDFDRPHHERIPDPTFRRAVDLLDAGDADGLAAFLVAHPALARQRVDFAGGNYFANPTLLEFVAENPTRHGRLPANIADVARVILEAGGRYDQSSKDSTLGLVASSSVAGKCGVQIPLIDVLCDFGADPDSGVFLALLYDEFEAVDALIRRGAKVDLCVAAAMGCADDPGALLAQADAEVRHRALSLAAQYGRVEIVRMLLDAGEDPNRYSPVGGHSHATPLHQAALAGNEEVVALLLERGARPDIADARFSGSAVDWADYGGHTKVAALLRAHAAALGRTKE